MTGISLIMTSLAPVPFQSFAPSRPTPAARPEMAMATAPFILHFSLGPWHRPTPLQNLAMIGDEAPLALARTGACHGADKATSRLQDPSPWVRCAEGSAVPVHPSTRRF